MCVSLRQRGGAPPDARRGIRFHPAASGHPGPAAHPGGRLAKQVVYSCRGCDGRGFVGCEEDGCGVSRLQRGHRRLHYGWRDRRTRGGGSGAEARTGAFRVHGWEPRLERRRPHRPPQHRSHSQHRLDLPTQDQGSAAGIHESDAAGRPSWPALRRMNPQPAERDDWNRHWDDYAASAQSNPAQRFRRRLILSSLALHEAASTPRVLDMGSGQGDFAVDVLAACPGAEVLGLELSASGVEIATRKVPAAQFLQCDLREPHEPPQSHRRWATYAVCSEVLEHLDDPQILLANARAWMAPNCRLIVTVPGGPMSAFDRHIGHRKHYAPEELRCRLEGAGFRVERASGAGWPFFDLY